MTFSGLAKLPGSARRFNSIALLGVLIAGVLAFYLWTVLSSSYYNLGIRGQQQDYYNLLADGFLDGHLYMKQEVPQSLIDAENPYDPKMRPATGALHDASYYKGRYYLYFGAAPVLTLFLPFTLLWGEDLPQGAGNIIFASAGFLASAGLILSLRRRYFASSSLVAAIACVLALGLGSMVTAVLRRPSLWEMPIAAGYAFAMLALFLVYRAIHARHPAGWLAIAGICLGLAVGSRPTYIVAAAILGVPLLRIWQRERAGRPSAHPSWEWWRGAIGGGGAFSAVIVGLLWYNYARFGNPLEFGLNYQLTGAYEAKVTHFSAKFVPFNWQVYYLIPAQWGRYFPFIHVIHPPTPPPGYYGIEFVYGVLVSVPLVWLAFAAPLGLLRRTDGDKKRLAAVLSAIALLYVPVGALMLFFVTAAGRYMVDFVPTLMLLACCGVLGLEHVSKGRWWRWPVRAIWVTLAAISIFFGTMASFQLHELLRQLDGPTHRKLANVFNHPTYWYETATGFQHGPLKVKLRLPRGRAGKLEPLVSTGWEYMSDHVFFHYYDDERVRIGFDHTNGGLQWSAPIVVDFDAVHDLRIEMGSLYPPEAHPFFAQKTKAERESLAQWLRVYFNDTIVLEGKQVFYDGAPESIQIGHTSYSRAYGDRFTGQILSVERTGYKWLEEPRGVHGPVKLQLTLPKHALDQNFPLVATGEPGKGNTVYVRLEHSGALRFGYDHSGVASYESESIPCDFDGAHTIEVRYGGLLPPSKTTAQAALRDSLVVKLDEQVVWSRRMAFHETARATISLARNSVEVIACEPKFPGAITSIARTENGDAVPDDARGPLRMHLKLPTDRWLRREPLLVTGMAGQGDLLYIVYEDERHVRFGFDHWGVAAWQSEKIAVDYSRVQHLELRLASLNPSPEAGARYGGEIEILLAGMPVWRQAVEFHRTAPETLTIAENRIGGSTCDSVFTGGVVRIERLP